MTEIPHFSDHDHDEPDPFAPHNEATPADWAHLHADASYLVNKATNERSEEPTEYPYVGWINRNGDDVSLTLDPETGDFRIFAQSADHDRDLDVTFDQTGYQCERLGSAYGRMFSNEVDDEGIDRSVVELMMSDAPGTYVHEAWRVAEVDRVWDSANRIVALSYGLDKAKLRELSGEDMPLMPLPKEITTSATRRSDVGETGSSRMLERVMFRPQPSDMDGLLVPTYATYGEYWQDGAQITEPAAEYTLLNDTTLVYAYAGRELQQTSDPHRIQEMAQYLESLLGKLQSGESEIE